MINYSGLKRIAFPTQAPDPYTPFVQAVQGLAGRAPQMSADMQRQEANKYRRAALDRMVQGAGMQAPQMEQGMDGKQALGVLLASLFGRALGANPGEVNDFVAGFTQARQNQASQANEQKMREFEMQQRQNQVLSQADLGYADIANDEANRLQGYIDRDRATTSERQWSAQQDEAKRKESAITYAQNRYYNANTPAEKQAAAAQLQRLGVAIDPATVETDVTQMRAAQSQSARNAWNTQLNQLRDDYGEIPEWAVPQLEQTKRELAAAFGVPETLFGQVPTGKTLAAQKFDQAKKQFEQTFQLRSEQFKETVAKHQRDYELAKDRIAIMSRNSATSASNLGMRMREFEYRKARDAAEKKFDATAKEITKVEKEIAIQQGVLKKFAPKWAENPGLITKEREKLDRLNAELETLKQMRDQSEAEAQEMDSALGDSGAPIPPAVQNTGSGLSATVDPLAANTGRNPNAGPPVQNRSPGNPKPAPKNNPNPQPKAGGGKSRTVNVGGTAVKVYPKKG